MTLTERLLRSLPGGDYLLMGLGVVVFLSLGIVLVTQGGTGTPALDIAMGVLLLAVGLCCIDLIVTHWRLGRVPRSLPSPRIVQLDTERATHLPRWNGTLRSALSFFGMLGLLTAAGAVHLWPRGVLTGVDHLAFAGLLTIGALGLWLTALSVTGLARLGRADGLWLTPTRLVHQHGGVRTEIGWDAIEAITGRIEGLRRLGGGASPPGAGSRHELWIHGTAFDRRVGLLRWSRIGGSDPGWPRAQRVTIIDHEFLRWQERPLRVLLDWLAEHPESRHEAGTPALEDRCRDLAG